MHGLEINLVDLAGKRWPNLDKPFSRGKVLYWQGDPVEQLFIIRSGAVKVCSISTAGQICAHGILGPGSLLGATDYFMDGIHETTAEVVENSSLIALPPAQFQHHVDRDPSFSAAVLCELAREAKVHLSKARELSFLDVQQRLKKSLIKLADVHGLATDDGIELGVNLTHEEMGELINANRTTITLCLRELKKKGYLRTRGRKIILIPIEHMKILDQLGVAIVSGGVGEAADLAGRACNEGVDPAKALNALLDGIKEVDRCFARGQMDINEVMWSAVNVKESLQIIDDAHHEGQISLSYLGRVVFGTVHGDIHDIGKTVVSMFLRARGFEVIDLGVDVAADSFIRAVREHQPDIVALSALLTSTQSEMKRVIELLEQEGLRKKVKVMIGGVSTTPRFAGEIGADGQGHEAREGVELAWGWCSSGPTGFRD